MTREEAIQRFQRMKKILSIPNSDAERTIEAIDMAIEVLKRVSFENDAEIKSCSKDSDLISRADAVPHSEQYKKGFEDAKRAFLLEYARESENMWKRIAELEVMFNAQKAISTARPQIVRCKDCRHANECHKSVQYTRNEPNTITIGYSPIEWCSRGKRRK